MPRINTFVIDSSDTVTDMCRFGTEFPTDKSPYSITTHRHPYTAIYDMLFSNLRFQPLCLGEVGVLDNCSMHMWRSFFPNAQLFGFEFVEERLAAAKIEALPNAHYSFMNVADSKSINEALNATGRSFDVLIDDSTHLFEHQINFVHVAINFVRPGGFIIVEDVFRKWLNKRYEDALSGVMQYFSSAYFIDAQHKDSYSGGNTVEPYYDNDKLLILMRNQFQPLRHHPDRQSNLSRIPVD